MKGKKEDEKIVRLNKSILVIALIITFSVISLAYALTFVDKVQSDFDKGTYNQTQYNTTNNAVQLNLSYNGGTYTSQIFNTGSNVSLNNLSWTYQRIQCPQNMSYINKLNGYCIDKYEATVMFSNGTWNSASNTSAWSSATLTQNAMNAGAYAGSLPNVYPWVYVNQTDARLACSRAGKHLCTSEEWLGASDVQGQFYNLPADLAVSPYYCNTASKCSYASAPGSGKACVEGDNINCTSLEGVYNMVGNVWEWTNETVSYNQPLASGWAYWNGTNWLTTTNAATAKYGNDGVYFLTGTQTGMAVIRGGAWLNGADAGPFCALLSSAPLGTSYGVGFRCCSS